MIEVLPPHEDVRTWRQFFIHIAAITIGLLIAIGLASEVQAKVAYSTLLLRLEENALQKKVEEISKIQHKFQH